MGENSKIEWTDHTFNPWIGCTKVSDGCKHCYAETMMDKRWGKVEWGPQGTRVRTSVANWKQPLKWNREAEAAGVRQRVFCASLADVFEDRPELEPWRLDLLKMIELTPSLDWLLLTKRPENVMPMIELAQAQNNFEKATLASVRDQPGAGVGAYVWLLRHHRVWIGTSVEDQKAADERIPHLLAVPARVRFLSMEPLLGPVDLWGAWYSLPNGGKGSAFNLGWGVNWVIVGGESGPKARPMHPDWVRGIRDQCQAAGVPFFFKQWGEWVPSTYVPDQVNLTNETKAVFAWPWAKGRNGDLRGDTTMMVRVGKTAGGRLLSHREWDEFPGGEE